MRGDLGSRSLTCAEVSAGVGFWVGVIGQLRERCRSGVGAGRCARRRISSFFAPQKKVGVRDPNYEIGRASCRERV